MLFFIPGLLVACFKCDSRDVYLGPDGILYEPTGRRIGPATRSTKFRPNRTKPYFVATPPTAPQEESNCYEIKHPSNGNFVKTPAAKPVSLAKAEVF